MGVIYIVALGVPSVHLNEVGRCFYKRPSKVRIQHKVPRPLWAGLIIGAGLNVSARAISVGVVLGFEVVVCGHMYNYICVCIRMCMYGYVLGYVCMYTYMYVCIYVCMYVCIFVCVYGV